MFANDKLMVDKTEEIDLDIEAYQAPQVYKEPIILDDEYQTDIYEFAEDINEKFELKQGVTLRLEIELKEQRLPAELKIKTDYKKPIAEGAIHKRKNDHILETKIFYSFQAFKRNRPDYSTRRMHFHLCSNRILSMMWIKITANHDMNVHLDFSFTPVAKKRVKDTTDIFTKFQRSDEYWDATERLENKKMKYSHNHFINLNKDKAKDTKKKTIEEQREENFNILAAFAGNLGGAFNRPTKDKDRQTFTGLDKKRIGFFPMRRQVRADQIV